MKRAAALFPIFLRLAGRRCLVVGAGTIAQSKIQSLLNSGAQVLLVAPSAKTEISKLAKAGKLEWRKKRFSASNIRGMALVIAATDSPEVNHSVFAACSRAGVWCNVVDDPEYCDFFYPAVVRRGPLQIAISTEGASPSLAARLRRELELQFGPDYADFVEYLREERRSVLKTKLPRDEKRARIEQLSSHEGFEKFVAKRKKAKRSTNATPIR